MEMRSLQPIRCLSSGDISAALCVFYKAARQTFFSCSMRHRYPQNAGWTARRRLEAPDGLSCRFQSELGWSLFETIRHFWAIWKSSLVRLGAEHLPSQLPCLMQKISLAWDRIVVRRSETKMTTDEKRMRSYESHWSTAETIRNGIIRTTTWEISNCTDTMSKINIWRRDTHSSFLFSRRKSFELLVIRLNPNCIGV